jgi:hypothetical protein
MPVLSPIMPVVLAGLLYMATIIPFPVRDTPPPDSARIIDRGYGVYEVVVDFAPGYYPTESISIVFDPHIENKLRRITVYRKHGKTYSYLRPNMGHDPSPNPKDKETEDEREFGSWLTKDEKAVLEKIFVRYKN